MALANIHGPSSEAQLAPPTVVFFLSLPNQLLAWRSTSAAVFPPFDCLIGRIYHRGHHARFDPLATLPMTYLSEYYTARSNRVSPPSPSTSISASQGVPFDP